MAMGSEGRGIACTCTIMCTYSKCVCGARLMAFSCFVKANAIIVHYFCILKDLNKVPGQVMTCS